ncbi:MAG: hypothetical protein HW421_824 [Ignavibacteria bacterium]|nr:hypothetical protein [Ignavibacteria bacterium]
MADTVLLMKDEYETLLLQAKAYQSLVKSFHENIIQATAKSVTDDFRNTGLYTDGFLEDLEKGLEKSSYFKK